MDITLQFMNESKVLPSGSIAQEGQCKGDEGANLRKQRVFMCDFWYGPTVLSLRPSIRTVTVELDACTAILKAFPRLKQVGEWGLLPVEGKGRC
jgi:hypothetical protein